MPQEKELSLAIRNSGVCCALVLSMTLVMSVGCQESQLPATASETVLVNPEADLEYSMERLEKILGSSRTTDSLGLRIKRSMAYEYMPIGEGRKKPTAQVTIKTVSTFVQDQPKKPKAKKKKKQKKLSDNSIDPELVDPYLEEEDKEFFDLRLNQEAFSDIEKPELEAGVKSPTKEEVNTYVLIYQQGKWSMKSEPESEHEKLWFDYALN